MTPLDHPKDLAAWQTWQRRRHLLREAKASVIAVARRRAAAPEFMTMHTQAEAPALLLALDATTPTKIAALIKPLEQLVGRVPVGVLAPAEVTEHLPGGGWTARRLPRTAEALREQAQSGGTLSDVSGVMSTGHYLPVGGVLNAWAQDRGLAIWVVQHGLLTPKAPPLPSDARVLAFSEADGGFWASGRDDVEVHAVGSQLLYESAQRAPVTSSRGEAPVFLGQLHGVELDRMSLIQSTYRFCRDAGAIYRPHPGERDIASRTVHQWWERAGIPFDRSGRALTDLRAPVVSTFSTGVLEAAARGLDAWVYHRRPPAWLNEFWQRYDMRPWGEEPTPPPAQPVEAPARRITDIVCQSN
ncbi:hypothetical protein [Kocuria massiliensis]|uniref:hypothetical protein n=1 Tax=Kocuria massiliensis TaxID=1926282 RepID=UPI000A1CE6DD|nr:hypothetical protein [Kocuria massiliensis]